MEGVHGPFARLRPARVISCGAGLHGFSYGEAAGVSGAALKAISTVGHQITIAWKSPALTEAGSIWLYARVLQAFCGRRVNSGPPAPVEK